MADMLKCTACKRSGIQLKAWKGIELCSTCMNLASAISNHRNTVRWLDNHIYGSVLVAGSVEGDTVLAAEAEYNAGLLDKISVVLGGVPAADLEGAVRELAEGTKVTTKAAPPAKDHGTKCAPQRCEELRAAMSLVLEVAGALRGACETPEKPGVLAGAVRKLVSERDGLQMVIDRLHSGMDQYFIDNGAPGPVHPVEFAAAVVDEVHDLHQERHNLQVELSQLQRKPALAAPDVERGADTYVVPDGYELLFNVFVNALHQAANGKGRERHATPVPFQMQSSCCIARDVGIAFPLGQAIKKAKECQRLAGVRSMVEILGSINYLAMAYIVLSEAVEAGSGTQESGTMACSLFKVSRAAGFIGKGDVVFAEGVGHD